MKFKILKPKKVFKKGSPAINPNTYWNVTLLVVFIVVIFAFVSGFLIFRSISKEAFSSSEDKTANIDQVNENRIKKALEYFSALDQKSKDIINSPSPIIDPSL